MSEPILTENVEFEPENYRRWLYRVAYDWLRASGRSDLSIDDLAQEGWIAMWRASHTWNAKKGSLPSWVTLAARSRMKDVLTDRKPAFGASGDRGTWRVPRSALRALPDPATATDAEMAVFRDMEAERAIERLQEGAEYGELARALADLTPKQRQYVEAAFWGDKRHRPESALWRETAETLRAGLESATEGLQ